MKFDWRRIGLWPRSLQSWPSGSKVLKTWYFDSPQDIHILLTPSSFTSSRIKWACSWQQKAIRVLCESKLDNMRISEASYGCRAWSSTPSWPRVKSTQVILRRPRYKIFHSRLFPSFWDWTNLLGQWQPGGPI